MQVIFENFKSNRAKGDNVILHNLKAAVINQLLANKRYPMQIRAACLVLRWVRICGISFGPGRNFTIFCSNKQPKNFKLEKNAPIT